MSLNQCQFIGNLGGDPDVKQWPDGGVTLTFSLGVTRTYKDRDGNKVQDTSWPRIVVQGKVGGALQPYLKKEPRFLFRAVL